MTGLAYRQPFRAIPKDALVAVVADGVMNDGGAPVAAVVLATRMLAKEFVAGMLPDAIVAALTGAGALAIEAGLARTIAGHLAFTANARRDDLAAGAKVGRAAGHD